MEHTGMIVSDSNLQQPNESSIDSEVPIIPTDPNKNSEIPLAAVKKIIQPLKLNAKFKDDAMVIFPLCVSKYISFVTAKAYDRCQREHRKILNAEDLLWAMENHGFKDYVGPLHYYLDRYRQIEGNLSINNGPLLEPHLVSNHGKFHIVGQILETTSVSNFGPGPGPNPVYGYESGPLCAPEVAVGMPPPTLPPPSLPSSNQGFSMESNASLDMVAAMMNMNEFSGDGSRDEFDPSDFLNLNYEDNI